MDARIENHKCKGAVNLEMSCPWINNRRRNNEEETRRWELRQQFPGYEVKQYNIVTDSLVGWSRELDDTIRELVGGKRQRAVIINVLGGWSGEVDLSRRELFGGREGDILIRMQKAIISNSLSLTRALA